jgi:hypothetical protein
VATFTKRVPKLRVEDDQEPGEHWLKEYWRPMMAFTYMLICVFDFLIMPAWIEKTMIKPDHAIELARKMPEKDQVMALQILSKEATWNPLTLRENGFFHLAMMTVLGVAAWTRGREKELLIQQNMANSQNPDTK